VDRHGRKHNKIRVVKNSAFKKITKTKNSARTRTNGGRPRRYRTRSSSGATEDIGGDVVHVVGECAADAAASESPAGGCTGTRGPRFSPSPVAFSRALRLPTTTCFRPPPTVTCFYVSRRRRRDQNRRRGGGGYGYGGGYGGYLARQYRVVL